MKSSDSPDPQRRRAGWKYALILVKLALGGILLFLLFTRGAINLESLQPLAERPAAVVVSALFILSTLVFAAIRWSIILRVLGLPLPLLSLLHIQNIATFAGQFLLGTASADAVRGVYAWRALRGRTARITLSILADRALGMVSLILIGGLLVAALWDRVQAVPQLRVVALSLALVLGGTLIILLLLFFAPASLTRLQMLAARRPRLERLIMQAREVVLAFRNNLFAGFAALVMSLIGQVASILGLSVLAINLKIGTLPVLDYMLATPLALVANMLPITPGGLGVGEAAFDQVCRWLEPSPSGAAYASIFLAYRAVSMLVLIVGPISFFLHRSEAVGNSAK